MNYRPVMLTVSLWTDAILLAEYIQHFLFLCQFYCLFLRVSYCYTLHTK